MQYYWSKIRTFRNRTRKYKSPISSVFAYNLLTNCHWLHILILFPVVIFSVNTARNEKIYMPDLQHFYRTVPAAVEFQNPYRFGVRVASSCTKPPLRFNPNPVVDPHINGMHCTKIKPTHFPIFYLSCVIQKARAISTVLMLFAGCCQGCKFGFWKFGGIPFISWWHELATAFP